MAKKKDLGSGNQELQRSFILHRPLTPWIPDWIKLIMNRIENSSEYPEDYRSERIKDIEYIFMELAFFDESIPEKMELANQLLEKTYDIENAPSKSDRYLENRDILKGFKTHLSVIYDTPVLWPTPVKKKPFWKF